MNSSSASVLRTYRIQASRYFRARLMIPPLSVPESSEAQTQLDFGQGTHYHVEKICRIGIVSRT
eukprot:4110954-Pyramimonas_sp.AAC.1